VINAGVAIKRGALYCGEGASRVMHDIYSIDGLEKWSKAGISELRLFSFIPGMNGVFSECIKTLEAQKDLYFASKFIGTTADFIKNPRSFLDSRTFLYGIGNWFELGKFLQKNEVVAFSICTELSNKYGAIKLCNRRLDDIPVLGSVLDKLFNRRLDDIPVLGNVFDRPKDICIFIASIFECCECYQKGLYKKDPNDSSKNLLDWLCVLKVTTSIGKMLLISCGKYYNKLLWFAVIDVVTQHASLASLILKNCQTREGRFLKP
jgi:hypothetical protein